MCGYDDWLALGVAVRNVLVIESIVYAYTRASVGWNCCVSLLLCTILYNFESTLQSLICSSAGTTDTHMGGGNVVETMAECTVELSTRCRGFSTDMEKFTACCLCLSCV